MLPKKVGVAKGNANETKTREDNPLTANAKREKDDEELPLTALLKSSIGSCFAVHMIKDAYVVTEEAAISKISPSRTCEIPLK